MTTEQAGINDDQPYTLRWECLDRALKIVTQDRNVTYGSPEDNFLRIAMLWAVMFPEVAWTPAKVALALDAVKTARLLNNEGHADSWIDKAGYAACGYEVKP